MRLNSGHVVLAAAVGTVVAIAGLLVFLGDDSPLRDALEGEARAVDGERPAPISVRSEYQRLQVELQAVKRAADHLRARLLNEPHPPHVDSFLLSSITEKRPGHNASRPDTKRDPHFDETIFVSVASYRDWECANTIRDMYKKAANPRRLYLGIIQQHDDGDPSCIPFEYSECQTAADFCPSDNIRLRRVRPLEAKGPTFGRYVAMLMYRDEKYFMMIDSHNRFLAGWDSKAIDMYHLIPSRKGVLSHYPNSWENKTDVKPEESLMVMCYAHFLDLGYLRLGAEVLPNSKRPRLQPYAAAGFVFADGALVREVPFDPYLDFLFDGEEILYSIRMWTHGWDIYNPTESVLFHYYGRKEAARVYGEKGVEWGPRQQVSQQRVQYILGVTYPNSTVRMVPLDVQNPLITAELNKYGLGPERDLNSYWRFAGVEPVTRFSDRRFCRQLQQREQQEQ